MPSPCGGMDLVVTDSRVGQLSIFYQRLSLVVAPFLLICIVAVSLTNWLDRSDHVDQVASHLIVAERGGELHLTRETQTMKDLALEVDDVVLFVGNTPIRDPSELRSAINEQSTQPSVTFIVRRDGEQVAITRSVDPAMQVLREPIDSTAPSLSGIVGDELGSMPIESDGTTALDNSKEPAESPSNATAAEQTGESLFLEQVFQHDDVASLISLRPRSVSDELLLALDQPLANVVPQVPDAPETPLLPDPRVSRVESESEETLMRVDEVADFGGLFSTGDTAPESVTKEAEVRRFDAISSDAHAEASNESLSDSNSSQVTELLLEPPEENTHQPAVPARQNSLTMEAAIVVPANPGRQTEGIVPAEPPVRQHPTLEPTTAMEEQSQMKPVDAPGEQAASSTWEPSSSDHSVAQQYPSPEILRRSAQSFTCESSSPGLFENLCSTDCLEPWNIGGWMSLGYHSDSNNLFNDRPNHLSLHQAWLFVEREVSEQSPVGGRADIIYGIDGGDTQSFGNPLSVWDFRNGFDFGPQAWAIPQLYLEFLVGDWSVKAGHFYTPLGYETVAAPQNFFYSHSMTMVNTEPFTHTGVLAERHLSEHSSVFAGWTLGWDTGFDQRQAGNTWLGGYRYAFNQEVDFSYFAVHGNLGARGDRAYANSLVLKISLSDDLLWISQSDYLRVASTGEDNLGLNQYLLYSLHPHVDLGARLEWWKGDVLTGYIPHGGSLPNFGSLSYFAATLGVNYRPWDCFELRPEVRYDWSPAVDYDQSYAAVDAILTF